MSLFAWRARSWPGSGLGCAWLLRVGVLGLAWMHCAGCASSLRLTLLSAAVRPPSHVALYFAAQDAQAEPVTDLLARDFEIYEDGRLVSPDVGRPTLANPEHVAQRYTLLLIDISASATASDQLDAIFAAARSFVHELLPYQHVAVYAFDGSKALYQLAAFGRRSPALDRLRRLESRDPSTNLNGAVLQALSELDGALHRSAAPLRFGTLVVFTDGVDRANRVPYRQMLDAVDATADHVYALGVGRELDDSVLSRIGKSGYVRVEEASAAGAAFHEIAAQIVRAARGFYRLSYCSPSRAGRHVVAVVASSAAGRGQLRYSFDATAFTTGCDPAEPPSFEGAGPTDTRHRQAVHRRDGAQ